MVIRQSDGDLVNELAGRERAAAQVENGPAADPETAWDDRRRSEAPTAGGDDGGDVHAKRRLYSAR